MICKKAYLKFIVAFISFFLFYCCPSFAAIRGDADNDKVVDAYDAYHTLRMSLNDSFEESQLQIMDMDCDTVISSYDAYCILKKSITEIQGEYVTPEMFGAVGDGLTDDSDAIEQCMTSDIENVILEGDYLITRTITTAKEKAFYNGTIICSGSGYRFLVFNNKVSFYDVIMTSSRDITGTAAHGETFQHTSSMYFVEAWGNDSRFEGSVFHNALIAIRGRISTGQTTVPENLNVFHCRFTECKIPIQGYFANSNIRDSSFRNDGDLYSGEHCVYLEQYLCDEMNISGCIVETYNTESGAAFQIYGKDADITTTPQLTIENCNVKANGIVSVHQADVSVLNTNFDAQHSSRYVYTVDRGTLYINGGKINHAYLISCSSDTRDLNPIAENCIFRLKKDITNSRVVFPATCNNCVFINWGGYAGYAVTDIEDCIFTRDYDNVVGKYYIGVPEGAELYVNNSNFRSGDNISYNTPGYLKLTGCHYINNIGTNVTNYEEIGIIREDIVGTQNYWE